MGEGGYTLFAHSSVFRQYEVQKRKTRVFFGRVYGVVWRTLGREFEIPLGRGGAYTFVGRRLIC
jgi:hypothetical protein